MATTPLRTALIAARFDHEERSRGWNLAGVGIGIAGVALLLGVQLEGSLDTLLGAPMLLLAGLGYTVLASAGTAWAAIALYFVPAFAVFYGVLPLDEPLTAASLAGLVLVVAGSALAARTPRS